MKNQPQTIHKEELSMDGYIARPTQMAEESRKVNDVVEDGELYLIVLNGLDMAYDRVIRALQRKRQELTMRLAFRRS